MDIIYRYCVCLMFNLFLVIFLVTILRSCMAVRLFFPEIEVNRWNLVVVIATHQRIPVKITSLCFSAFFFFFASIPHFRFYAYFSEIFKKPWGWIVCKSSLLSQNILDTLALRISFNCSTLKSVGLLKKHFLKGVVLGFRMYLLPGEKDPTCPPNS